MDAYCNWLGPDESFQFLCKMTQGSADWQLVELKVFFVLKWWGWADVWDTYMFGTLLMQGRKKGEGKRPELGVKWQKGMLMDREGGKRKEEGEASSTVF